MTYEEIFNNYINEINNNIDKFFDFNYILSTDNQKSIQSLSCIKNNKHSAYYDSTLHIFYCPHCGYSKNLIELTADILGITNEEALYQILIKKLNYNPSDLTKLIVYIKEAKSKYDLYYKINEKALTIFRNNFKTNEKARKYAYDERNLTNETLDYFSIGSADNSNLILNTLSNEYPLEVLFDVGLLGYNKEENQYYDVFRNRLIFPIFDELNRIIAFGGRTLGSSPSKYLNTKTTPIFKKGSSLYAIDKLEKNCEYDKILISEGYMDVITMHQHGIKNVVGNLGTAITKEHLSILYKYTNRPVVMLDGDTPGIKAMKRTIEQVDKVDTVILPNKLDPDEFLKEYSSTALINCINENIKTWGCAMKDNLLSMEGNIFENMYILKQF